MYVQYILYHILLSSCIFMNEHMYFCQQTITSHILNCRTIGKVIILIVAGFFTKNEVKKRD